MPASYVSTSHLCLIGDAVISNITPLLDSNFCPSKAYLVVAPQYAENAKHLGEVYKQLGVEQKIIQVDTAWDIEHIREQLLKFMETQQGSEIILNLSAGTRPMMLAAYDVFMAYEKAVFHVHPHTDHVVWLSPSTRESFDLEDRLKLREFLLARGSKVVGTPMKNKVSQKHQQLTAKLINGINSYAPQLKTINWLAMESEENLISPKLTPPRSEDLYQLIEIFESENICSFNNDNRLTFINEENRFYCNGGWLEEYVYSQIHELKNDRMLQDLAMGVVIEREGFKNRVIQNELDVAFLYDNQFYLIECKTKIFNKDQHDNGSGAETLYKLDSLVDLLAGTSGHGMLVSYLPLSKWDKQRAADLGLKTCVGHELKNLQSIIKTWVKTKNA